MRTRLTPAEVALAILYGISVAAILMLPDVPGEFAATTSFRVSCVLILLGLMAAERG